VVTGQAAVSRAAHPPPTPAAKPDSTALSVWMRALPSPLAGREDSMSEAARVVAYGPPQVACSV